MQIVSAPDGSLYIGDFNLVRKLSPDGRVSTILHLNATTVAHRYYLAVNPQSGALYVSDPEGYRIMEVVDTENPTDILNNWKTLIGGKGQCMPDDEELCGDNRSAMYAQLIYPKGLAVSAEGVVYFADGTTIRKMDVHGVITTLISQHSQFSSAKAIPCDGTVNLKDINLKWPVDLAVNPLDNSVYFTDDNIVMKITENEHLKVVAGRPLHCSRPRYIDLLV